MIILLWRVLRGILHCKLVAGFVVGEAGGGEGVDEGGFVDVF